MRKDIDMIVGQIDLFEMQVRKVLNKVLEDYMPKQV